MPIQTQEKDGEAGRSIAIIGIGGRFPRARNVDEFWLNLAAGIDSIRAPTDEDSATARLGARFADNGDYVANSYYLDDVKLFDADFFRFTPAEARLTDPQHRIFLECAWEALESAGYISKTERLRVGVYAGASISHYLQHNLHSSLDATGHPTQFLQRLIGNDKDYLATHTSYKLNLRGPSIGVQTACSTSLVALWLACQGLADHQCDLALAGGVTVKHATRNCLGYVYEQGNILSPDGHCRPFDAAASGTAFGSGAGVVLIKRLDEAIADRDPILAVVREVAVNNDGAVKIGFTAPSVDGQAEVVALAQATAQVHPESIGYIEAHGTGTPLGDPVEIAALTKVFRAKTRRTGYCAIGSVKSNVGHLEAAAGMAGLIKTVLALRHRQIPPTVHFKLPNPAIDFASTPFFVNAELRDWPANGSGPRRAGVSSFGIGGTNAHAILEEAPPPAASQTASQRPEQILTLSAQDDHALRELAARYVEFLASEPDVASVCFTSNTGRRHFSHRLAAVGETAADLRTAVAAFGDGMENAGLLRGDVLDESAASGAAFLFTGQGSQYSGMGKALYDSQPVYRATVDHCAAVLRPLLQADLLDVLHNPGVDEKLHATAFTQPALFALEYALAKLWESWGVGPVAVMGHSVGEFAAACIAGVFTVDDALQLVAARGRLMQALPRVGSMAAVLADEATARAVLGRSREISIAAVNGPRHTVISGRTDLVDAAVATLAAQGCGAEKLKVSHAFHSPLMEPMLDEFRRVAERVSYRMPVIPFVSNVTGLFAREAVASAGYWVEHVLSPVRFAAGVKTIAGAAGCEALLEIGPHPVLLGIARQCATGKPLLPTLRRGASDWRQLLLALGRLYVAGAAVDWERFDAPYEPRRTTQPTYPFQRKLHWVEQPDVVAPAAIDEGAPVHPLLGRKLRLAGSRESRFEWHLGRSHPAWLQHHKVFDQVVFPMSGFLEAALAAGSAALGTRRLVLENVAIHRPLVLSDRDTLLQTVLTPDGDACRFEIFALAADDSWTFHADGRVLAGSGSAVAVRGEPGEPLDVNRYYRRFADHGLQYGADFRTIRNLHRTAVGSVAEVTVADANGYFVHPALLDGCFQSIGVAFESDGGDTRVPAAIELLEVFGDVGGRVHAEARTSSSVDIDLVNPAGAVVVRVEGLSLRRVSARVFGAGDTADCVHRMVWRAQPRTGAATVDPSRWLIVRGTDDTAHELAAELRKRGHEAHVIEAGAERPDVAAQGFIHFGGLRSALTLAQSANRPLWLVTRGTQPAGDVPGPIDVDEAAVWGLGRTIARERPETHCRCLDLDPARPAGEIGELADEILHVDAEEQVAFRAGTRFVTRLEPWHESTLLTFPDRDGFRLAPHDNGVLADMRLEPLPRRRPGHGEVEIRVAAAALNFRDVLSALRALAGHSGAPIGSECAGTVVEVGEGVTAFHVGDEVVALADGCLASRVTVPQELLFRKPASLGMDEAAAVPIAFLTAYHGLHRLAKIRRGERVLIHAAAGGVGQAAVRLAREAGAEIFATAHPRKWGVLQSAGVQHVMSSRTTDFAATVLERTGGEGVDIVLNCLNDEFIPKSFEVLRRGGRFLEIGKIRVWDQEQARAVRPDAAYFLYDIAEELRRDPGAMREILEQMLDGLAAGRWRPPLLRLFPVANAPDAFQRMAAGKHAGKVVLSMEPGPLFRRDGTYLVTGGLGDLGLIVARWVTQNGGGRLVLCGRTKPSPAAVREIEEIVRAGTAVEVLQADVASTEDVARLIAVSNTENRPLRGIVHAAGVLRDALLNDLTWDMAREVQAPKVDGAWNLHTASLNCPLDFFVCFSSTASVFGSAGQANYAAANAFLDALAHHRDALGLPALTVNWGAWADAGMAARLGQRAAARRAASGIADLETETALRVLERLLREPGIVQAVVATIDSRKRSSGAEPSDALLEIRKSAPNKRHGVLTNYVASRLATALGLGAADSIGPDRRFMDLGMDSLIAIELRNRLQSDLSAPLAQTVILDYPTLRSLTGHLEARLFAAEENELPSAAAVEDAEVEHDLDEIAMLADSEIRNLLARGRSSIRPS